MSGQNVYTLTSTEEDRTSCLHGIFMSEQGALDAALRISGQQLVWRQFPTRTGWSSTSSRSYTDYVVELVATQP